MGTEVATPSGGVISLLYFDTQAVSMDSCDNVVADAMKCQVRLQHGSITAGAVLLFGLPHEMHHAHLILVIKTVL